MTDDELGAYLEQQVADGFMRRDRLPDGRISYVHTDRIDAAFAMRQRALDAWQLRMWEVLNQALGQ